MELERADSPLYEEKISSVWTELLFIGLAVVFGLLFIRETGFHLPDDPISVIFLLFTGIFVFYAVSYRQIVIRVTPEGLKLTFGLIRWNVPLENIANVSRDDDIPGLLRYGGAGVHFMTVRRRYRVSFNFLEYPRVVVALRKKTGPVRDVSFTTRSPEEVVRILGEAANRYS